MSRGTESLETREGSWPLIGSGLMLAGRRGQPGWRPRRYVMADIGYALVLIGGFAVLVLALRGLQRL
jgi:hypothetical protein